LSKIVVRCEIFLRFSGRVSKMWAQVNSTGTATQ